MLLGDGLEREAHGAGANAGVEDRQRSGEKIGPTWIFKDHGADAAEHGTHSHLHEIELDAVDLLHVIINAGDLDGVEKCAEQHDGITEPDGKFSLLDAEKIQPRQRQKHRQPHPQADLAPEEDAQKRHQHHICRRNEASFADGRVDKADLLRDHAAKEQRAAEDPAGPECATVTGRTRHIFSRIAMVEIKKHRDQRNNSDNIARRNERDRPDMIHADALGNKGNAPDGGGHEQQKTVEIGILLFGRARHAALSLHKTGGPPGSAHLECSNILL